MSDGLAQQHSVFVVRYHTVYQSTASLEGTRTVYRAGVLWRGGRQASRMNTQLWLGSSSLELPVVRTRLVEMDAALTSTGSAAAQATNTAAVTIIAGASNTSRFGPSVLLARRHATGLRTGKPWESR